jgi:SAM-dependent methyltransferase
MDRSAYDRYLEIEEKHFWRRAKRRLVKELVAEQFGARRDLHILDIGGACSLALKDLQSFGAVECVEPDQQIAEVARATLGLPVHTGALPDQLPELAPAQLVTMLDVLEHIDDDHAALLKVRELLTPDGVLVLTVPALTALWSDHDVALHHKRRYRRAGLVKVLEGAGFRVLRASYYTSLLLPLVAGQRWASRLRPRRGAPKYDVKVPGRLVNRALGEVMELERGMLGRLDMPIGSALFAVAKLA